MVMYKQTLYPDVNLTHVRMNDVTVWRRKNELINSDCPFWRKIKLNLCLSVNMKGKAELQLSEDSVRECL